MYASFLTGVHRITHASRRITSRELRCSLVVTGGVYHVTGGVRVGLLGLFKRLIVAV